MKHFSPFVIAASMALAASTAQASVSFTLNIDHADYIKVSVDWQEVEIVEGLNNFNIDDYANFSIEARDGQKHYLQEVLVDGVDQLSSPGSSFYRNQYNISELNGTSIETKSCLIDDLRTGSFTVTIDNPSRISYASTDGYPNSQINAKQMEPGVPYTVKFIPGKNNNIQFNESGAPFYKMYKNGEEFPRGEYNFTVPIEDGMELNIQADYPEMNSTVNFNFLNDGAALFKGLNIYENDKGTWIKIPVEVIDNKGLVPIGSQIVIDHNPDFQNYVVSTYTVGSKSNSYVSESYQCYVTTEEVTVTIDAQLSNPMGIEMTVDNGAALMVHRSNSKDILEVKDGVNNLTLYSTNNDLSIKCYPQYEFVSVTRNGETVDPYWDGSYRFYSGVLADGDKVEIKTAPKETYKAYITVKDASNVILKRNQNKWYEETVELKSGRNEFICNEGNNDFYIIRSATGYINGVNINGTDDLNSNYGGYYTFSLESDYEVMVDDEAVTKQGDVVIYVDKLNGSNLSSFTWSYFGGSVTDKDIVAGYNVRDFFHGFNTYKSQPYFVYGEPVTYALYVNDEEQEIKYPSYPSHELTLKDGDVVKVFLATDAPEKYTVDFNTADTELSYGEITYDVIRKYELTDALAEDDSEVYDPLTVLQGTVFDFTINGADALGRLSRAAVLVNGEEIEADEEGVYHVTVNEPIVVTLKEEEVEPMALYLVGDFNEWEKTHKFETLDGINYTLDVDALMGEFRITDEDASEVNLGSNGEQLVNLEPYSPVHNAESHISFSNPRLVDVHIEYNLDNNVMLLSGTGIVGLAADEDADAVYFTTEGIRVNGNNLNKGIYIKVENSKAVKEVK